MVYFSGCMSNTSAWVIQWEAHPNSLFPNNIPFWPPTNCSHPIAPFWFSLRCRECVWVRWFHTTQHLLSASNILPKTHSALGIPTSRTSQWQGDTGALSRTGEVPAYSGITEPQPAQGSLAGCSAAVTIIPIKIQDGQHVTEWLRLEKVVRLFIFPLSLHFNFFFSIPSLCLVHQTT